MKLGQGYIFTGMCDLFTGGGSTWQVHPPGRYIPLGRYTPRQLHPPGRYTPLPGQVHPPAWAGTPPWAGTHPLGRYTPPGQVTPGQVHPPRQVHPQAGTPPRQVHPPGRYTLWAGTPPRQVPPPKAGTPLGRYTPWGRYTPPLRYSQCAGSMHPTGMQSCSQCYFVYWHLPTMPDTIIVHGEGNFWFRFRSIIQFLPLWSIDDKAEADPKTALAQFYKSILLGNRDFTTHHIGPYMCKGLPGIKLVTHHIGLDIKWADLEKGHETWHAYSTHMISQLQQICGTYAVDIFISREISWW